MSTGVTVDFNANLSRFTSGIDKATNDLNRFQSNAQRVSANITKAFGALGVGVSVVGLAAFNQRIIDLVDTTAKLSQRIGINIKDIAAWQLAADLGGTSIESVTRGVKGLSAFMVENGEAMRKAGIDATDANGAMIQLADLFSAMPDGVEKTALAVKLFGKAGMDMIPVLNQGSAGLRDAQDKAKKYGEQLEKMAPDAQQFNDQLTELALQAKVGAMNITGLMLPALSGMATWLNDLAAGGERGKTAMEFLTEETSKFTGLIPQLRIMAALAERIGPALALAGVGGDPSKRTSSGRIGGKQAGMTLAEEEALAAKNVARMRALGLLGNDAADKPGKAAKTPGSVDDYALRTQQAVAGAIGGSAVVKAAELADQIAYLDKLVFDYGLDLDVAASALDKLTGSTAAAGKESERLQELLAATPSAALEKTRADMQLLAEALEKGAISAEQFNEAALAVNNLGTAVKEADNFARDMGLSFSSAFEDAVIGGKKFSDVLKGLSQDVARIITRKTITKKLGGAVTGYIDKIDFGKLFSFDGGGFTGSGSRSGGVDGLGGFPAILHPNETVIDHAKGGGGGGGGVTYIFNNDLRGASVEAVARLEQLIMSVNGSIERRAMGVMSQARVRGA